MTLYFTKTTTSTTFLPLQVAKKLPFSSKKMPQILDYFSVKPNSMEAKTINQTIKECEKLGIKEEEKYYATSLESMIDFCRYRLGKSIQAISTEVKKESPLQTYTIEGVKKIASDAVVVCHKKNYTYTVFYCHKTQTTMAYKVSMVGVDGTKVEAVAVCHTDTLDWNPKHLAFQVLKVKPGTMLVGLLLEEQTQGLVESHVLEVLLVYREVYSRLAILVVLVVVGEWMEDKSTSVGVGKGGVSVDAGKGKPGGTSVGVRKGGVSVNTGHEGKPVYVEVSKGLDSFGNYGFSATAD
ncbi:hypothetical protein HYC85_023005 [Camellia sinensis]|uniref:BURP domain-containing protein n=1 Tax=Camellia sinensis TaxID=4442 RepID=A0A7J7GH89_CAMSI|nr:hypothetical protein HYC85_023005 [Camellia sinensis]